MTAITVITMDQAALQSMLDQAAAKAVQQATERTVERWNAHDLATHYNVSVRTIQHWRKAGRLPPRDGTWWTKASVLKWDRERAP